MHARFRYAATRFTAVAVYTEKRMGMIANKFASFPSLFLFALLVAKNISTHLLTVLTTCVILHIATEYIFTK